MTINNLTYKIKHLIILLGLTNLRSKTLKHCIFTVVTTTIILSNFLIINNKIIAQDIHFSQYMNSPLNLNPALTAYSKSTYRITLNSRSQWASVTVPYQNISASFETKLIKRKKQMNYLGFGIIFNKDQAGDSKYGTIQAGISASFIKALKKNGKNIISIGLQSSYFQRTIDYTKLYFQDSWNGINSNLGNGNTENFSVNSYNFFDISTGLHWYVRANKKLKFNSGISLWHINKPIQYLMSNNTKLNIKSQFYSEAIINTDRPFDIVPSLLYSRQGPYNEFLLGVKFYYQFYKNKENYFSLTYGLYGRSNDALILYLGIDYKNLKFAGTYDFNLSSLSIASNAMGGMELSVQWLISKSQKHKLTGPSPCPIF